ncbi:hypothetical protein NKDENANG_02322 [Candidatus Entotheonellaceae bacterium PAL068K]
MKHVQRLAVACVLVLALGSMAAAQAPTPVTRMGNWVEIGNEAWMDIIGTIDMRWDTQHNPDFEDDIRDRGDGGTRLTDAYRAEIRWGADFMYKKNLRTRILFETDQIFDGNRIDGADNFGVERFWVDYKWPGTPLRMRAGAALVQVTQAGMINDDNPGFAVYAEFPTWSLWASAYIRQEGSRTSPDPAPALANDNDNLYYNWGIFYTGMRPHRFQLDVIYYRDRFDQSDDTDVVQIQPSWTGRFGPISGLLEFGLVTGSVEDVETDNDYDVLAWTAVAYLDVRVGMFQPFVGIIYGSGDDDASDNDLEGFDPCNLSCTTGLTGGKFGFLTTAYSGEVALTSPARSTRLNNNEFRFRHPGTNPYSTALGTGAHVGVTTGYSNPGTIVVPAGVHIFPALGHQLTLFYVYNGIIEDKLLEDIDPTDHRYSTAAYHEVAAMWNWTINPHFDIRVYGGIAIPAGLARDIAETVFECGDRGTEQCSGEDPALRAEIRLRGRF